MSDRAKWEFLERAPARDARDPKLKRIAEFLWHAAEGRRLHFVKLCAALARDCIRYQIDTERTGGEDIAGFTRSYRSPLEALRRGVDDCDAKARLFCALCLACRVPARMVPLWNGAELQHVSAECQPGAEWLPVELTLARARVGEQPGDVPTERNGTWLRT